MIGILLVAHDPLAHALLECASHVLGGQPPACIALDVLSDCDLAGVYSHARELAAQLDGGQGVLVLTDLVGATPANIAARLAQPGALEVLSGANLPMLLRALTYRNDVTLEVLAERASAGATASVMKLAPQQTAEPPVSDATGDPSSHSQTDELTPDAKPRLPHQ